MFQCAPFYLWHVSIPTFNLFEVQLIFTSNAIIHDDAQKWHIFFINLFGRSMEFAYFRRNELGKRAQATNSLDHQQNQKHFQFYMVVAAGWRKSRNRFRPQCLISKWFLFSVYEPFFLILVSNSRSINDYHCKSSRFEAKHNNYNAPFKLCPIWIHSLTHTHKQTIWDSIAIDMKAVRKYSAVKRCRKLWRKGNARTIAKIKRGKQIHARFLCLNKDKARTHNA